MSQKKQGSRSSGARKAPAARSKKPAAAPAQPARTGEFKRNNSVIVESPCEAEMAGQYVCELEAGHKGRHRATLLEDLVTITWEVGAGSYRSEPID